MSVFAFISPMPGSPSNRFSSSRPSFASRQTLGRHRCHSPRAITTAQLLRPLRHVAREPMQGGPLAKGRVELVRIHRGDLRGIQRADAPLELQQAGERLL